ncbi:HAD family hydrolase [Oerskovia sp. KBS0722]|uniref:HAD family hydrolase n=1 Tax=Oerskovia sp. KBS0722 TaxID=1179673 RepID=UPI00110EB782|nr:HAD family hydrolase [Oerskovia sp. KBS0722]QDW61449.1 HAD family hydrolase [Oerskovia sp. KBS0722]
MTGSTTSTTAPAAPAARPPLAIELVALDVAGTTVEEGGAVYDALHAAVLEYGSGATSSDVQHWMGAEKRAAITALLAIGVSEPASAPAHAGSDRTSGIHGGPGPDEATVDAAFVRFTALLHEAYRLNPPTPIPGAPEAFAALRAAGVKVALTTGFTRDVTRGILDVLGWTVASGPDQWLSPEVSLDAVTCADEVPLGRPAPYMVHRDMERTGVLDVARVLVAGDTVLDLRSGVNARAGAVVGVLTGKLGAADLGRERHDFLLDSVADLPELVARLNA